MKVLILLLFSSVAAYPKLLPKTIEFSNSDLVFGIHYIFDNYYYKYYKTAYIVSALESNKDPQTNDLKNAIIRNRRNKDFEYVVTSENHSHIRASLNIKRNCMVFLLDKFDSFERIYKILTPGRFYLHGYYLFVLTRGIFEEHEMKNLTSSVWKKGISNFNIIYANEGVVNFTIIRPYSSKSCSDTTLISVNVLKDKKFQSDTESILFPNGMIKSNLNKLEQE